jgi:hypothetical protein
LNKKKKKKTRRRKTGEEKKMEYVSGRVEGVVGWRGWLDIICNKDVNRMSKGVGNSITFVIDECSS